MNDYNAAAHNLHNHKKQQKNKVKEKDMMKKKEEII